MTFLPVVGRELRVASRRRHTYWTRFLAGLAGVALMTWIWFGLANEAEHARGQLLFRFMAGLALAYCLFSGVPITSDCVSQEKREGTLGLLFLTDLRGYDVVLGKLAATSLNAIYRLMAVFPLLTVPLLLGGLRLVEVARMAAVLANTLFFSLAAGMLASVLSKEERRATAAAFFLVVGFTAGPAILGWLVWDKSSPFPLGWLLTSGIYPAVLAEEGSYKLHPTHFWIALASTQVVGWIFLIVASLLVTHVWQDRPGAGGEAPWGEWRFAHGPSHLPWRRRLLEVNPTWWLVARDRLKPVVVYIVLGLLAAGWLSFYARFGRGWLDPTLLFLGGYGVHTIIKLWLASEASRMFFNDRRTGALELILSTPLTVDEILAGHLLGLQRQFTGPVRLVLLADIAMLVLGIRESPYDNSVEWLGLWAGLIAMFLVDLYALAWLGLWLSLCASSPLRAWRGVVARVLLLPWVLFLFGLLPLSMARTRAADPNEWSLLGAGLILSLMISAAFAVWARANLEQKFRTVVAEQFGASNTALESDRPGSPTKEAAGVAFLPATDQ